MTDDFRANPERSCLVVVVVVVVFRTYVICMRSLFWTSGREYFRHDDKIENITGAEMKMYAPKRIMGDGIKDARRIVLILIII